MDEYLKRALQEAIDEIAGLRRVNEIQSAQLDIVFIFRDAIRGARHGGMISGAGEDVAWKLRRILLDAEADEKRKREESERWLEQERKAGRSHGHRRFNP